MYPEITTGHWTLVAVLSVALFTNCIVASPDITTVSPPTPSKAPEPKAPAPKAPAAPAEQASDRFILDTANLDLNHDGCISGKTELDAFKQHVTSALAGTPNSVLRAHSIVYRTDVNRDGRICWCDFISIYLHDKTMRNKHSVPFLVLPDTVMFTQLDDNGDGQLTGEEKDKLEAEFASCLPQAQAQFIINSMAGLLSKDDSISREEFQQYFDTPRGDQRHALARAEAAVDGGDE